MSCLLCWWYRQKSPLLFAAYSCDGVLRVGFNTRYKSFMVIFMVFALSFPVFIALTLPFLEALLGKGLEFTLGVSSKVIHPTLIS
jgi:hypothetical protein